MGLIVAEAQPPVICVARAEYRQLRKQPWLPSRVYIIPTNSAQSPSRMLKRLDQRLVTEYIRYICIAGCLLETMSETRTPGFCALCKSRCGSILVVRDGRFVGQEPNPEHPTGQSLCVKGRAAAEIVYNHASSIHCGARTQKARTTPAGTGFLGTKHSSKPHRSSIAFAGKPEPKPSPSV